MKTVLLSMAVASFATAALVAAGTADAKAPIKATYTCDGGQTLKVVFEGDSALVTSKSGKPMALKQGMAADGFLYSDGKHSLRGRGNNATWTSGDYKPINCWAKG